MFVQSPDTVLNQQGTCEGPFSKVSVIPAQSSSKGSKKPFMHEKKSKVSIFFRFEISENSKMKIFSVSIYNTVINVSKIVRILVVCGNLIFFQIEWDQNLMLILNI